MELDLLQFDLITFFVKEKVRMKQLQFYVEFTLINLEIFVTFLFHFQMLNQFRIEWMTEIYHLDELCISKAPSENYVCILIKRVLTR